MHLTRVFKVSPVVGIVLASCVQPAPGIELRDELLEMGRTDQEAGKPALVLMQELPDAIDEFMAAVEAQDRIHARNFSRLETIVAEYGWPGRRLVGEQASGAALIVLQHADVEHQKRYLPLLRAAAADGDIAPFHLARLEDGIRQREGRNQIYGTLVVSDSNGQATLYPIEDPENLDERREAAGLSPIDEQLKEMETKIGIPIDRGNLAPIVSDSCDLMSVWEVEAATGVEVVSMERLSSLSDLRAVPPRTGTVCRYTTRGAVGAIDLSIYSRETYAEVAGQCDARAADALENLSRAGVPVCIAPGLIASLSVQSAVGYDWRTVMQKLAEAILQQAQTSD